MAGCRPWNRRPHPPAGFFFQTVDMAVVVVGQFAGADEGHGTCRKRKHIRRSRAGMAL